MKTNFLAFCIGLLILFSCANENKPTTDTSEGTTNPALTTTPEPQSTVTTMPAPTFKMESVATGLNPAHGEPGHRCDIAVGAPLNSAPATPQVSATVPSIAPLGQVPATITAPGMNPPHGQPGHDCAIAVGAPLKK